MLFQLGFCRNVTTKKHFKTLDFRRKTYIITYVIKLKKRVKKVYNKISIKNQIIKDKIYKEFYIDQKKLQENNIYYPIKLEYHATRNDKNEYGIKIIKKEYRNKNLNIETKSIERISKDEKIINDIISILSKNIVTPVGLNDAIYEISRKIIYLTY